MGTILIATTTGALGGLVGVLLACAAHWRVLLATIRYLTDGEGACACQTGTARDETVADA